MVCYSKEPDFIQNKEEIISCDIVFIAVPTPSTPEGFDSSIVKSVLPFIGKGNTAVIKSTMLPGSTRKLAEDFPEIYVMHSPEFLREKTAAHDTKNPERNIIGIPYDTEEWQSKAQEVIETFAPALHNKIIDIESAELIKYMSNCFLTTKVVFFNAMYDIAEKLGLDWESIHESVVADSRIGVSHTQIMHESGHGGDASRGAGGHCFIKDFTALRELYERILPEETDTLNFLKSTEMNNVNLLKKSNKDLDIIQDIYGKI